jgi:hypothetical protein
MKLTIKNPLTAALQNAHDGTCFSAAASAMGAWPLFLRRVAVDPTEMGPAMGSGRITK